MEETNLEHNETELEYNANLDNIVLALLFASDEPLSVRRMASIIEDTALEHIKQSIENWRKRIDEESWSIALERVAGGYQLVTRSDYAAYIGRLYSGKRKFRLSKAGLETLAIIAYKQPITRAEIENVRGVGSGGVIANLMERSLIKITGKAKVLGAPFLYGTTSEFLEYLGLDSLRDLPSLEELEALLEREAYPESAIEGQAETDAVVAAAGAALSARDEDDDLEDDEARPEAVAESGDTATAKKEALPWERDATTSEQQPEDEGDGVHPEERDGATNDARAEAKSGDDTPADEPRKGAASVGEFETRSSQRKEQKQAGSPEDASNADLDDAGDTDVEYGGAVEREE